MKRTPASPAALVLCDADNTLWDTNAVFAAAQLALLSAIEDTLGGTVPAKGDRLAVVRAYDQELAERHHASLNYPVDFLIRALGLAISGIEPALAARQALSGNSRIPDFSSSDIAIISSSFQETLSQPPKLRAGVREGLEALHDRACLIIIVTEGSKKRCEHLVDIYDLGKFVDKIVCAPKQAGLFRRIKKLAPDDTPGFVIGDQKDRDLAPARQAGFTTILFPGGFVPKWAMREEVDPDFVISSFEQAVPIVVAGIENRVAASSNTQDRTEGCRAQEGPL